ncbi:mRNA-binding ribosome synthesis protein nop7 [Tulasnella sp. 417]|nr:mRNA-binding ribosome synthesis protein nop7 [Tulasnella sp. 417]
MGRETKKGTKGPNSKYITRTKAIRKLQISLNDFRRLCILKGIVPREPPSRKKANHGNSAPTSFYHVKDIAFLAHEPIIQKLREHKIFLRRMSRAMGKQEWGRAKALEENRPTYKLDHIVKERYPTFIDAVRDLDDAICCVVLGASLSQHRRIPKADLEDCARLSAEWQLYVTHTRALRKTFLSIKGIYYQAEVMGETVTWVAPYQFMQKIPMDVDFRVMRSFLEFYKTLLGFVFYKLYTDAGLVYPPPLDLKKDAMGGGVDAYRLQPVGGPSSSMDVDATAGGDKKKKKVDLGDGKVLTSKQVQKTIASMEVGGEEGEEGGEEEKVVQGNAKDVAEPRAVAKAVPTTAASGPLDDDALPSTEEFIPQPSKTSATDPSTGNLITLHALANLPTSTSKSRKIFEPYVLFISRESPRHVLEFVVKSFGGVVGWPATCGSGSPIENEDDERVTHVIIDRPLPDPISEVDKERRRRKKYVQPQWVVDSVNAGRVLLEDAYAQGKTLPPHLSPFNAEGEGAYDPLAPVPGMEKALAELDEEMEEDEDEEDEEEGSDEEEDEDVPMAPAQSEEKSKKRHRRGKKDAATAALQVSNPTDADAIRKAELEAERLGIEPAEFDKVLEKAAKQGAAEDGGESEGEEGGAVQVETAGGGASEENMAKMLLSSKKRKLFNLMKRTNARKEAEKVRLQQKKIEIAKQKKRTGVRGDVVS